MRLLPLILIPLLSMPYAEAKPKKKASGASRMESSDFFSCVQSAVNGRTDEVCVGKGESNGCIGMRLAIDYGFRKTRCFSGTNSACLLPGHKQNNQSQWISVGSGHLSNFLRCVRLRYGSDSESGLQAALADKNFLDFIAQTEDGSANFGLNRGEILLQSLRGRRFSSIIQNSPKALEWEFRELQLLKGGADNPGTAEPENAETTEASKNLSQQGESLGNAWGQAYGVAEPDIQAFNLESWEAPAQATAVAQQLPLPAVDLPTRTPATAPATVSSAPSLTIAPKPRNDLIQRSYKENPYSLGLDKSLFDRVSLTYRRHSPILQNVDLYLKSRPQHPHDVRDEIQRGEAIEL
jgi:hypothetical protein